MEEQLPAQMLPVVPHITFGLFNLAVPNIIAWLSVVALLFVAAWLRLPRFFEPES